jgi:predicted methyltransferase
MSSSGPAPGHPVRVGAGDRDRVGLRDSLGLALKRLLYEGFGRDKWQQPERVVDALALAPGRAIADLGSGTGYFTFRFARTVAPSGMVFAVDTDDKLLGAIRRQAQQETLPIKAVRASEGELRLPTPVDVIFLSNVFHHLPEQADYFRAARSQLHPGGRVAILESRPEGLFARFFGHSTDPGAVHRTMEQAGYRLESTHDFVDRHSFQIFTPVDAPDAVPTA